MTTTFLALCALLALFAVPVGIAYAMDRLWRHLEDEARDEQG